ncbi:MAG TPA: hypothetical protein P5555_13325 [Candidatus Paceibacterota bacterium]|nr:hypothetical protein [Verrucomicrobiota bacterium]HRZ46165.1 hypothetical protein [Candidatus Paceibacterota bacterium]
MIAFSGKTIRVSGASLELEYPVADAFELEDRIIVLFNPDACTKKFGQFPNLVALRPTGERLWTAELPTTTSGDRYYKVASRNPLVVYSIHSVECEIDIATGRIKARRFSK